MRYIRNALITLAISIVTFMACRTAAIASGVLTLTPVTVIEDTQSTVVDDPVIEEEQPVVVDEEEQPVVVDDPAAEEAVEEVHDEPKIYHGLSYELISSTEQELYDKIVIALQKREPVIVLQSTDHEAIQNAYFAVLNDHPEFFWTNTYSGLTYPDHTEISPVALLTDAEIESVQKDIDAETEAFNATLDSSMSEYDIVFAAYTWIVDRVDYVANEHDQTIKGSLSQHEAVCAGYARGLQYLLLQQGIRCDLVHGYVIGRDTHSWDIVWIDGTPTQVDVTWGDPIYEAEYTDDTPDGLYYDYLCITSEEMLRDRVITDPVGTIPECTSHEYDYYRRNGLYCDYFSPDELQNMITSRVNNGRTSLRVKYSDEASYNEAVNYVGSENIWYGSLEKASGLLYWRNDPLYVLEIDWTW